ncbi:hypothetical protein V6N12_028891 [Hibiscus sabdariffa]|uniref:Transmembrane protein n=1 Tax=Hibiscus sabdariffa TaxID=183260 RepID=A0ABR2F768_9ROSI
MCRKFLLRDIIGFIEVLVKIEKMGDDKLRWGVGMASMFTGLKQDSLFPLVTVRKQYGKISKAKFLHEEGSMETKSRMHCWFILLIVAPYVLVPKLSFMLYGIVLCIYALSSKMKDFRCLGLMNVLPRNWKP